MFNILVVWFLTGFWHGADWTFIVWGLYFALFLVLEKFVLNKFFAKLPRRSLIADLMEASSRLPEAELPSAAASSTASAFSRVQQLSHELSELKARI